jgi:hypothetical protein
MNMTEKIDGLTYGMQVLVLQILLLPTVLLMVTALLYWVTVPVTVFHFVGSVVLTVGISLRIIKRHKRFKVPVEFKTRVFLKTTAVFVLLILFSMLISVQFEDSSREGMAYGRLGVQAIADGWNPFYETGLEQAKGDYVRQLQGGSAILDNYPKAIYINAAAVYRLTGSIESGKMFNILFLVAAFLITLNYLSHMTRMPEPSKVLAALLTALNPVALNHLFSFNGVSQMASLMTVVIILVLQYIMFREKKARVFLFITLITLVNVAFTGLIYGIAIVMLAWLVVFIVDRDRQLRYIRAMVGSFLLGLILVGFQPYVTNVVREGAVFYPSPWQEGGEAYVQLTESRPAPESFMEQNRFIQLFGTLLAKSDQRWEHPPRTKLPFTVDENEIGVFSSGDARYGGFGPFFGSVLLLTILASMYIFRAKKLIFVFTFISAAVILTTALLNPMAWWARQAPQLWLLPITFIVSLYYIPKGDGMAYVRGFALSALLLNSYIVFVQYCGHI